jgi:hypothetical protein
MSKINIIKVLTILENLSFLEDIPFIKRWLNLIIVYLNKKLSLSLKEPSITYDISLKKRPTFFNISIKNVSDVICEKISLEGVIVCESFELSSGRIDEKCIPIKLSQNDDPYEYTSEIKDSPLIFPSLYVVFKVTASNNLKKFKDISFYKLCKNDPRNNSKADYDGIIKAHLNISSIEEENQIRATEWFKKYSQDKVQKV